MTNWLKNLLRLLPGRDSWKNVFEKGCREFSEGDFEAGEQSFRAALAKLPEDKPQDLRLFTTLICLGSCLRAKESYSEAEVMLRRALTLRASGKNVDDDTAYAHKELGVCLYESGKPGEAVECLRESLRLYEQLGLGDKEETADCLFFLARCCLLESQFDEALPHLERSLAIFEACGESRWLEIADTLHCQSIAWNRTGDFDRAEANLRRALQMHTKAAKGQATIEIARCTTELAAAILSQSRYDSAEVYFREAMEVLDLLPSGHTTLDYADSLAGLATCCRMQKKRDAAIDYYEQALAMYRACYSGDHDDIATVLTQLAVCHSEAEEFSQAERCFKDAVKVAESISQECAGTALSDSLYNLANCYSYQRRYDDAVPLYERALELSERTLGPEHYEVASKLTGLAYCYQLQDKYSQAKPLYKRALTIYEHAHACCGEDDLADNLIGLANCYLETGEYDAAKPLYERALAVKQNKFDPKDQDLATRIEDLLKRMEKAIS